MYQLCLVIHHKFAKFAEKPSCFLYDWYSTLTMSSSFYFFTFFKTTFKTIFKVQKSGGNCLKFSIFNHFSLIICFFPKIRMAFPLCPPPQMTSLVCMHILLNLPRPILVFNSEWLRY